ncbi:hypothetical protein CAPTEDRAFT_168702 [Capitella teleta]|uniref:Zinc finger CCCH-type with G patch domain-containing protein n=1 Tax=Capitella teleta TaxID=283909 RepID=R7UKD3_CAPTE|nr:hypothetical protein CAPTEDRAFT_168702 [Capitella teleta]|eukprot:ELU06660.1 hypothetical protein CAPTEDRAFT_168702 [Capitella teleta]
MDQDEGSLEASIQTLKDQLAQVETALEASSENEDLKKLKADMVQLITLTEETLLGVKKKRLMSMLDPSPKPDRPAVSTSSMDLEMAAFNVRSQSGAAINDDDREQEVDSGDDLPNLSGLKCRVPFSHHWGELSSHNAMILCADDAQENSVRVLFTHPTHRSMLPCPFYLEDKCKYSIDECRYSHGLSIKVSDLQEFLEPDLSTLKIESRCLAKDSDSVWYPAQVVDVDDQNHTFTVMFDADESTRVVELDSIVPRDFEEAENLDSEDASRAENSDPRQESLEEEDATPVYLWRPNSTNDALAGWESHTKGIASKLMAKMGYITGQGLGKNGEGRTLPVPIQLLPQGKSLDQIMALKEASGDKDMYDVLKQQNKSQKKKLFKETKQYDKSKQEEINVFDFINKKLKGHKGDLKSLVGRGCEKKKLAKSKSSSHISERDLHSRSDKHLNVQLLKTDEEIRSVKKEIQSVKSSIARNSGQKTVVDKCKAKLTSLETYLKQLQSSQTTISKHRRSRSEHKKMTIF